MLHLLNHAKSNLPCCDFHSSTLATITFSQGPTFRTFPGKCTHIFGGKQKQKVNFVIKYDSPVSDLKVSSVNLNNSFKNLEVIVYQNSNR